MQVATDENIKVAVHMASLCFTNEEIAIGISFELEDMLQDEKLMFEIKRARMLKSISHWEKVDQLANAGEIEMIQLRNQRLSRIKSENI